MLITAFNSTITAIVQSEVLGLHVVGPSVRLSVTLVDQDDIGWNLGN